MDLILKKEGQPITYDLLKKLPEKIELYSGKLEGAEKLLEVSLYHLGLSEFVRILPRESRKILIDILNQMDKHY
jgi:hypothetical protein